MKNYFIPEMTLEQLMELREANVAFSNFELDGGEGVLIAEDSITQALRVLGLTVGAETETGFEGIIMLSLSRYSVVSPPSVTVAEWFGQYGRNPDKFVRIIKEVLVPVIGRDIVIANSDRHPRPAVPADGKFHLFVGYGQRTGRNVPRKIFGVELGEYTQLSPEGEGWIIADPETDTEMIQVQPSAAWILCNCCHYGDVESEWKAFRRLCEELAKQLALSPEERSDRQRKLAEDQRKRSREEYVRECSARFEKTLAGTRDAIAWGHSDVTKLQQELARRIRETAGAEKKLEQLSACKGGELEKYGKEFDKLLTVPKVRDIQVANGVIKVFTDVLYCVDPRSKKRHEIGAFRIEIFRDCTNGGVRWFNLTRQVDAGRSKMQAPHVNNEGKACVGNTAEIWPELIGFYEFAAAAMVAIQFVESVNTDDEWGRYIDCWPVA